MLVPEDILYFGGLGEGEKSLGTNTIGTLINSKHTISIVETEKYDANAFSPAKISAAMKEGIGSGGQVQYNPKDDGIRLRAIPQ